MFYFSLRFHQLAFSNLAVCNSICLEAEDSAASAPLILLSQLFLGLDQSFEDVSVLKVSHILVDNLPHRR